MRRIDQPNHDVLRTQPRSRIKRPGSSRKDPSLTGVDPDDDGVDQVDETFSTGQGRVKGKLITRNLLASKGQQQQHGYHPFNSMDQPTGAAAFIQHSKSEKPPRSYGASNGTLGLKRDDSRVDVLKSSSSRRLISTSGPPIRIPAAKPSLEMQVDLSNDPEEPNDGPSSPTFGDATNKFLKPRARELIQRSNDVAMRNILDGSTGNLNVFGGISNTESSAAQSPPSGGPLGIIKNAASRIGTAVTNYWAPRPGQTVADSDSGGEIEIESGKEEFNIGHLLNPPEPIDRYRPTHPRTPEPPMSPSKLPTFRIAGITWGENVQYYAPPQEHVMTAKLSFRLDGSELIIQLIRENSRHSFPIDVNSRLRQFVSGPFEGTKDKFIDLYYVKSLGELADAGFNLSDPQYANCTNVRLFIEVQPYEQTIFDTLCKKLSCLRYMLDHHEEYQSKRPFSHYERTSLQTMGVPYAVNRRPARNASAYTRNNIRSSPYDPSSQPKRKARQSYGADDEVMIVQSSVPTRGQLMFIYPEDRLDGIHMTTIELARLQPGIYLNDNNIDFDLSRMYHELLSSAQQDRTFVYNCFFYKRLTSSHGKESSLSAYERIKSWTGDVNIFNRDFLIIPINEAHHWYTAVIINPGWLVDQARRQEGAVEEEQNNSQVEEEQDNSQVNLFDPVDLGSDTESTDVLERTYIVILDSLFNNRTGTMTRLKKYLVSEARAKLGLDLDPTMIKGFLGKNIPKQDNTYDCGCFLLQYVQEIFEHHDTIRPELIEQRHHWFAPSVAKDRRGRMAQRMRLIAEEYRERHPDMHAPVDLGNSSDVEEITIDLC